MTPARLSPMLRVVGAAVAAAVVVLGCAGRAAAGCGEYVIVIGPDGKVQLPAGHSDGPVKGPCHGPNCSGAPKAPAPVPPAPTGPAPVVKALVPFGGGLAGLPAAGTYPSAADGCPVRRATSIFHPPRAS